MDECIGRYGRHRLYGVPVSVLSTHSPIARLTPYTKSMNNTQPNFDRFSFAALAGRVGQQPANYANDMGDGDFDDFFTAEDYDRRRYERDARQYGRR